MAFITHSLLIDYIGVPQGIIEDKTTTKGKPYVVMKLKDCSNKDVEATLWDEIATSLDRFNRPAIEASSVPIVLAFTAVRVQNFRGKIQIKSSNGTYVYLNPTTPETHILMSMYERLETKSNASEGESSNRGKAIIQPSTNNITITSLLEKTKQDLLGCTFTLEGTVTYIETTKNWHSTTCPKCGQSIHRVECQTKDWFCTLDGLYDSPNLTYRLSATISDDTGSVTATIFDSAATSLLGLPCAELLVKENPTSQLRKIEGTTATFEIQATKDDRSGVVRCTINKATNIQKDPLQNAVNIIGSIPQTPQQAAPVPKMQLETTTKRPLLQNQDDSDTSTKKAKGQADNN